TSITALLIASGIAQNKRVNGVIMATSRHSALPQIKDLRELSPVCVNKPMEDTKGEKGTTAKGTVTNVISPEIIKLRR
ncbi:hypothetical protein NYZ78_18180, partial [Acinetobacter baumannii]|nr:hypothetical protein [Acinetobacter baumannii]